jgi:hypothetical protein
MAKRQVGARDVGLDLLEQGGEVVIATAERQRSLPDGRVDQEVAAGLDREPHRLRASLGTPDVAARDRLSVAAVAGSDGQQNGNRRGRGREDRKRHPPSPAGRPPAAAGRRLDARGHRIGLSPTTRLSSRPE